MNNRIKNSILCLSLGIIIAGCSGNKYYSSSSIDEINRSLSGKRIIITLKDSRNLKGKDAFLKTDMLNYDIANGNSVSINLVHKITTIDPGKGARNGGIGGLLIGGLIGALIGYSTGDDHNGIINLSVEQKARALGIGCGIIGGILGAGVGAMEGYRVDHYFRDTLSAER